MSQAVVTYDFSQVKLVVGGFLIEGFEKGSSIKVARDEDGFTDSVGADGKTVRSRNHNRNGSIEIKLQAGAPANAILSGLAIADEASGGAPVPIGLVDLNANPLTPGGAATQSGWVKKLADGEFQSEAQPRDWVLRMADMDYAVGGYGS